jgi:PleD family two-component response regulator
LSGGVVTTVPPRNLGCEALLEATQRALAEAKQAGGGQVAAAELRGDGG